MYADLIRTAEDTMAANQRIRRQTANLQDLTRGLLLRYRGHRFPLLVGASDASDDQERVCMVCRNAIKNGEGRYRVGETEFHPECFKCWMTTSFARGDGRVD